MGQAAEASDSLRHLIAVMDRLRSPGGCPWDARQTHRSLVEYLMEESYETIEAIESGDRDHLREELGDLLLQVIFHARIAQEDAQDPWGIDEVADDIVRKLMRRHPHVFGDGAAQTAADAESRWHQLKAEEKGRTSVTEGIPEALPALLLAAKLQSRSAALDIAVPDIATSAATPALDDLLDESEFGDFLYAVVAAARERGWDSEAALRGAVRRQRERILEHEAAARGAEGRR